MAQRAQTRRDILDLIARQRAVLEEHPGTLTAPGTAARLDEIARACRTAMELLEGRVDAEEVLARRDPLPESTERALARLRAAARTLERGTRP